MKKQNKYVYHGWPSKNKFYCKGRLISGPDRKFFYLTLILLITPYIASLYVISSIMKNFSIGWIFYVIETYLFASNLSSFFLSAFMDPGIIPRRPAPPINESNPFDNPIYPVSKIVKIVDVTYSLKYCDTCNIYRPARCIHCGMCNNCVDRFDHHCPWVGNCIGKRNYNIFLVFVYGVILNSMFLIGLSVTDMVLRHNQYKNEGKSSPFLHVLKTPVSLILGLFCILANVLVGILGVYHCKIIKKGVTTNENIKGIFDEKNPYSKGCFKNWLTVCCPPRYPKFVKYHYKIENFENV